MRFQFWYSRSSDRIHWLVRVEGYGPRLGNTGACGYIIDYRPAPGLDLRVGVRASVDPTRISVFCEALKDRLTDPPSGLGKAYLQLLVDEVRLEGRELKIRGSYSRLADAIGLLEKKKLGEVPSFARNWRARQDSNPRPFGSQPVTRAAAAARVPDQRTATGRRGPALFRRLQRAFPPRPLPPARIPAPARRRRSANGPGSSRRGEGAHGAMKDRGERSRRARRGAGPGGVGEGPATPRCR